MKHYSPEFIGEIRRLHLEEGRSISSILAEYKVSKSTISKWVKEFRKECLSNPEAEEENHFMKENVRLRKELAEAKKEVEFLKKAAAFFAREIDERLIDSSKNIILISVR